MIFEMVNYFYCALSSYELTHISSRCTSQLHSVPLRSNLQYRGGSALRVSIECSHKQLQLFRISLDARTVLVLLIIWMIWGILRILKMF